MVLKPDSAPVVRAAIAQAIQAAIEAETNEDTYVPPDLMQHVPGVGRPMYLESQVNLASDTTLANLTGFSWTTGANESFTGLLSMRVGMDAAGDIKYTFTGPAGGSMKTHYFLYDAAGNLEAAGVGNTLGTAVAVTSSEAGVGTYHRLLIYTSLEAEATAGTFQFQWAQNTSSTNTTSVFVGSGGIVHKVPE